MLLLWACCALVGKPAPSIVMLMADEMDGRILDPESPQVHPPLPNLHRLAREGAIFTRTYAQSMQCVPSRSAMMVGLRTDQIQVYDNGLGIIATGGDAQKPDSHCVASFGAAFCLRYAEKQRAPKTFIDHLADAEYNVSLYGKMHAGAGLDRYPGAIQEFPFDSRGDTKILREWSRGLGPITNVKGKSMQVPDGPWTVPDNIVSPNALCFPCTRGG